MTPEQRAKRIYYHTYQSCEDIAEHVERIVKLEELVIDMYDRWSNRDGMWSDDAEEFMSRAHKLGIEVSE